MSCVAINYENGYAEGRRSGIHCVVPMQDSVLLADADRNLADPMALFPSFRAYWIGLKRGFRLHYADAHAPTVLAARERHERRHRELQRR